LHNLDAESDLSELLTKIQSYPSQLKWASHQDSKLPFPKAYVPNIEVTLQDYERWPSLQRTCQELSRIALAKRQWAKLYRLHIYTAIDQDSWNRAKATYFSFV
jgi:hypothetical protein